MLTFPIVTERLELAPLAPADRDVFVAYRRVPDVARWQSWSPDYSVADADALIGQQPITVESGSGRWLQLAVRRAGVLVGDVAIHALAEQPDTYEVGVTMAPETQGSGYATEALSALVEGLFAEARGHSERRNLEDEQRKRIGALDVPTYEIARYPGGVDLGVLYEVAAELRGQGLA